MWVEAATGHNPHDPVPLLAAPPSWEGEPLLLAARAPAQNWRRPELVRSQDGGLGWQPSAQGLALTGPLSGLAWVDRGPAPPWVLAASGDGAWLSQDGGLGWARAGLEGARLGEAAAVSGPAGPRLATLQPGVGLWLSDDRGTSWVAAPFGVAEESRLAAAGAVLAVTVGSVLLHSTDGGDSWASYRAPGTLRAVAVAEDGRAWVGGAEGGFVLGKNGLEPLAALSEPLEALAYGPVGAAEPVLQAGLSGALTVLVSTDGGARFEREDLPANPSDQAVGGHFYRLLAVDELGSRVRFAATFEGLFTHRGGAQGWEELDLRPPHLVTGLSMGAAARPLVVGTYDGGLYLSTSGGESYEAQNAGLPRPNVYDAAWATDRLWVATLGLLAGSDGALGGYHLYSLGSGRVYPTRLLLGRTGASAPLWLVGTREDGILRSLDEGESFEVVFASHAAITSLALDPSGAVALAGTTEGRVLWSPDAGATWSPLEAFPAGTQPAFVAGGIGHDAFLVGSVAGAFTVSTEGKVEALPDLAGPVQQVAAGPEGSRAVVLSGGGMWVAAPGEAFVDRGLPLGFSPHEVKFSPDYAVDRTLVAAWGEQVALSEDGGGSWQAVEPDTVRFEESCQAVRGPVGRSLEVLDGASAGTVLPLEAGEEAHFAFQGRGLRVLVGGGGQADLALDDGPSRVLDARSLPLRGEQALGEVIPLAPGSHHARLVVREGRFRLDAFEVVRREVPPPEVGADTAARAGEESGSTIVTPAGGARSGRQGAPPACGCGAAPSTGSLAWWALAAFVGRRRFSDPTTEIVRRWARLWAAEGKGP